MNLLEKMAGRNPWLVNAAKAIDEKIVVSALSELERRQSGWLAVPDLEDEASSILAAFVAWRTITDPQDGISGEKLAELADDLDALSHAVHWSGAPVSVSVTLGDGSVVSYTADDIRRKLKEEE